VPGLDQLLEPRLPQGDDRNLGAGEEAVGEDERDQDDDVGGDGRLLAPRRGAYTAESRRDSRLPFFGTREARDVLTAIKEQGQ
jgi:hypothetical protein